VSKVVPQVLQPAAHGSQKFVVELLIKLSPQVAKHYFPFKNFPLSQVKQSFESKVVLQVLQPAAQGSQTLVVELSIKLSPQVAKH